MHDGQFPNSSGRPIIDENRNPPLMANVPCLGVFTSFIGQKTRDM